MVLASHSNWVCPTSSPTLAGTPRRSLRNCSTEVRRDTSSAVVGCTVKNLWRGISKVGAGKLKVMHLETAAVKDCYVNDMLT